MIIKIKGRTIVLQEKRPPIQRAVKALRLSQKEVTLQRIVEVAKIYSINIRELSHLYWKGV